MTEKASIWVRLVTGEMQIIEGYSCYDYRGVYMTIYNF
jgi:hypothetical protein